MAATEPTPSSLSRKIDGLFRLARRPDGLPFSNEEVATACREATGVSFSTTYLWQLRTGRRNNPTKRHLEALADHFEVPVAYFFDDEHGVKIVAEIELLLALRDAGVRSVALRAVGLSSEALGTVSDLIDVIAVREAAARSARDAGEDPPAAEPRDARV